MMPLVDANVAVASVAAFVSQHEGSHSGDIRLEGHHHQITQKANSKTYIEVAT